MFLRVLHTYRAAFAGLPREIWYLSLALLVNRAGVMVFPFFTLYLVEQRGFSTESAGLLLASFAVGGMFGTYFGGQLSDRVSPVLVQIVSLTCTGLGFIVLGQLHAPWTFPVVLISMGVLGEAARPATTAAVAQFAPPILRARAHGLLRLAINLGVGIGPVVGGFLASVSYAALFWVDGLTCLISAVILWRLLRAHLAAPAPAMEHHGDDPAAPVRSPLRDGPFIVFVIAIAACTTVFFQLMSTVPLYYHDAYGLSEAQIGIFLGINPIVIVLVEMLLLQYVQRFRSSRVLAVGALLTCAGFGIMPLGSGMAFVVLTILIWTAGEMLLFPISFTIATNYADARRRGAYLGVLSTGIQAACVVAPLVGTTIYRRVSPDAVWYACGLVGVALVVTLLRLPAALFQEHGESSHTAAETPRVPPGPEEIDKPRQADRVS